MRTFEGQGGNPEGCGVPLAAGAAVISISATSPTRNGFVRAWPFGSPAPNATILNFGPGISSTNATTIPLCVTPPSDTPIIGEGYGPCETDLNITTFMAGGGRVHIVGEVVGYFAP